MDVNAYRNVLIPDYHENPNLNDGDHVILPSFKDIRRNTLQSLYGIVVEDEPPCLHDYDSSFSSSSHQQPQQKINLDLLMDKSPKGSVDEGIRSLVDLINAHPSYATLSSCSGRISLFDPNNGGDLDKSITIGNSKSINIESNAVMDDSGDPVGSNNSTGKGYGSWLITSHATITSQYLIEVLDKHAITSSSSRGSNSNANSSSSNISSSNISSSNNPERQRPAAALIFKHEPLLLHIAACNLRRARQLLTIACNLGFRESGLVVTSKRITVAIRSHSLSLTVPISSRGHLRPSDEYLSGLVNEANDRFHLNEQKLRNLEKEIMGQLFRKRESHLDRKKILLKEDNCHLTGDVLPDLNLWGHSAVVIPLRDSTSSFDSEIIVLGGYGAGPKKRRKDTNYGCSRSDKVFNLKLKDDSCDNAWEEIVHEKSDANDQEEIIKFGMKLKQNTFTAREGHSSCLLQMEGIVTNTSSDDKTILATFGGRASPSKPKKDLLLTFPHIRPLTFYNPVDLRGEIPSARWGHNFIALSGNNGRVAVLIGGRDETQVFDSIHVLSFVSEADRNSKACHRHFLWERIELIGAVPRFHHSSVIIDSKISSGEDNRARFIVFGGLTSLDMFHDKYDDESKTACQVVTLQSQSNKATIESIETSSLLCFGASSCYLPLKNNNNSEDDSTRYFARVGGLPHDSNCDDYDDFQLLSIPTTNNNIDDIPCVIDKDIDFGSMIHHVVLDLPSSSTKSSRFVSIGGGVPTFAFGQSFAKSYVFSIINNEKEQRRNFNILETMQHPKISSSLSPKPLLKANGSKSNVTNVIYVKNQNAKELKQQLQSLNYLDRDYRMTKADDQNTSSSSVSVKDLPLTGMIAVPITDIGLSVVSGTIKDIRNSSNHSSESMNEEMNDWMKLIEGIGVQEMPYSTKVMGRK